MELTKEQKDIINTVYNADDTIIINAYAGTGKTTTIVETIKEIRKTDKTSKILYLVFNKSMVEEAKNKFNRADLRVDCYTTHGFAYKQLMQLGKEIRIMTNLDYNDFQQVKEQNFKFKYIKFNYMIDLFNIFSLTEDSLEVFLDNLRNDCVEQYGIESDDFSDNVIDCFETYYKYVVSKNKYTHNMYLKEYALNCNDSITEYKYVFLDEAQDLNPFMLNIINRIQRDKMWVVGDKYQRIYGWNKAINSMDYYKGNIYPLSVSFRLNENNSLVANSILSIGYEEFAKNNIILPFHNINKLKNSDQAILFRRNAQMFEYAVSLIHEQDNIKVHFLDIVSGRNSDSFDDTFSDLLFFIDQLLLSRDGESEELNYFRSSFKIRQSKRVNSYVKIAKKEGSNLYNYLFHFRSILDLDFLKYFKFFQMYENTIVDTLIKIRESENNPTPDREYWLCTAYRSKGLEWDYVKIAPDSWSIENPDELNLIYVACTRAKIALNFEAVRDIIELGERKRDASLRKELHSINNIDDRIFQRELQTIKS